MVLGSFPSSLGGAHEGLKTPLTVDVSAETADAGKEEKKWYPGEGKGFVEEMRFVAMKLHTMEQAKEGEKVAEGLEEQSPATWESTVDGYLKFLVDSKLVYDTLEMIVEKAPVSYCAGKILNGTRLEFYKWDGDLSELLQNVREKLNKVA